MTRSEFQKQPISPKSVTVLDSRHAAVRQAAGELAAFCRGERASGVLADSPRHGLVFFPGRGMPHVQAILDYLLAAMVLAGEAEAERLPRYNDPYLGHVDPVRDWYMTPLGRQAGEVEVEPIGVSRSLQERDGNEPASVCCNEFCQTQTSEVRLDRRRRGR